VPSPLDQAAPDAALAREAELPPPELAEPALESELTEPELIEPDVEELQLGEAEPAYDAEADDAFEEEPEPEPSGEGGGRAGTRVAAGFDGDDGGGGELAIPAGRVPQPHARPRNRLLNFLQGSWRELQRVQWPDRRQVMQATGVVLGFVIVAGLFLGAADWVAGKVVNFILNGHF
jgi:preprotein translocase SecE subunit